ncbi:hypothetical protein RQP53_16840 [Paucibacter sp. APW11]|uniref:Uncharacterized protein n=1 Tax=Roseateles aquae TaxID=3077235 RepID=A0ABU3PG80_9BURK|nr:hypothetical protein [Paucibacter sp. APW11]MDT9000946.1 hypothetical protein [Paucibacter sp. APW11]
MSETCSALTLRAQLARQLLDEAPLEARSLSWAQLAGAPDWLALDSAALQQLMLRCGSVLAAPALRLWIAGPARERARAVLGVAWWRQLRAQPDWPSLQTGPGTGLPAALDGWPGEVAPEALAQQFREAGAAVLLASLPHGALRHAAARRLGPVAAWVMPQPTAGAVLQATLQLQQRLGEEDGA